MTEFTEHCQCFECPDCPHHIKIFCNACNPNEISVEEGKNGVFAVLENSTAVGFFLSREKAEEQAKRVRERVLG